MYCEVCDAENPTIPPTLVCGQPPNICQKLNVSKIRRSLAGCGAKSFRGIRPPFGEYVRATYYLAYGRDDIAPGCTVSPLGGETVGTVKNWGKFARPPRQNLGADPNFTKMPRGQSQPLQIPTLWRKKSPPILGEINSENFHKNSLFSS